MFSQENRCIYHKNVLGEVICQLRFPKILAIEANLPVAFQEAIRDEFPIYTCRKEAPAPKLTGTPGNMQVENQTANNNYQFSSEDGAWRVNLTDNFISLSCSQYPFWEVFAKKLDKPLAAFIQIYKPAFFERVGLRYLNFISRKALELDGTPFRELIHPCWLGILAEEGVPEAATNRCSVDTEFSLPGGCRAKIHAGPGMIKTGNRQDPEIKFIFDQDLYLPGNVPVNQSAHALQTLHGHADSLFRGAITHTLHEAMDPEII